jgi:serine/threonine protein kinase/tetratricopeptide (TPR) repeat protein
MIGRTISHYEILSKLGEGGMGVVYRARDLKLPRFVALKFLPSRLGAESDRKRFIREAETASSLDHPNICAIYEIDETPDGQLFIAMPCYEGEPLRAGIGRGPLELDQALEVALQVASGLSKAHEKGIVHRDIKPENVLVTSDGLAKIVDFGLAKLAEQTRLTRTGAAVGTVTYMSPEQARGDPADHRSDIWSLGVMLYEMITGRAPFRGERDAAVLYSIVNAAPDPVTGVRTGVPLELERVIAKCLEKNPQERYQHADELLVDLKKIRSEMAGERRTPLPQPDAASTGRHLKKLWVPALFIAALATAFFLRPILLGESPLTAPKPIAVISFENQTDDESYDYLQAVIPNLLITRLEQSKHLSVVTWERLQDLLRQRGRSDVVLIDKELGFELCQLDGIDTIVLGSFASAGDVFVTDVKVLDVRSKELLKSASAKGQGIESILANQIDDLGDEISRGIGLSDRSIAVARRPVAEVTTRSMDAYHFFLKGRDEFDRRYPSDARASLERAVALDSTFAVAWLYLGRAYRELRDINARDEAYIRAKRMAASAPEKDRLYIEAIYANAIEKNEERYEALLRELVRKYPKEKIAHLSMGVRLYHKDRLLEAVDSFKKALELDPEYGEAWNGLAYAYADLEDYPAAIDALEHYAAVSPASINPIDSMAEMYFRLGDLDKAEQLYRKTLDIRADSGSHAPIAYIAALQENYGKAIESCRRLIDTAPSAGLEGSGNLLLSFNCFYACRQVEALHAAETSRAVFQRMGFQFGLAGTWWIEGLVRYQLEEYEDARMCYSNCLSVLDQANMLTAWFESAGAMALGLADLKEDRIDAARKRLAEIESARSEIDTTDPAHSRIAEDYVVILKGEILLAEERLDDAIEVLGRRAAVGIPTMGSSDIMFYNLPAERDALARAYAAKGSVDRAIAEYERLITFDPESQNRRLVYPLLHYRLAKLYEENDDAAHAIREYEKFLEICQGAAEPIPEVSDARARMARLAERASR